MVGVKRYLGILLLVTFETMQGCLLRVDSKGGFVIKITHMNCQYMPNMEVGVPLSMTLCRKGWSLMFSPLMTNLF